MNKNDFVFFGSSSFSEFVLDAMRNEGFEPKLWVKDAKSPLPALPEAEVYVVASFGKILAKDVLSRPRHGSLNVHPSLLPKLRGASPIQETIIQNEDPGVSIILMDEEVDHGPILAQRSVGINPWPQKYEKVEEILGRAGGELLAEVMPKWVQEEVGAKEQNHSEATFTKKISKEDSNISNDSPELALRKIYAYHVWPRARLKDLIVTEAHLEDGKLVLDKVIPPGKKEMIYSDYLRGKH